MSTSLNNLTSKSLTDPPEPGVAMRKLGLSLGVAGSWLSSSGLPEYVGISDSNIGFLALDVVGTEDDDKAAESLSAAFAAGSSGEVGLESERRFGRVLVGCFPLALALLTMTAIRYRFPSCGVCLRRRIQVVQTEQRGRGHVQHSHAVGCSTRYATTLLPVVRFEPSLAREQMFGLWEERSVTMAARRGYGSCSPFL